MYKFFYILFLTLSAALPAFSDIYQWQDNEGIQHFSNVTPPLNQEDIETSRENQAPGVADPRLKEKTDGKTRFEVIKVYDGDSIKVRGSGLTFIVRLVGIDTPETGGEFLNGQPYSEQARQLLKKMVAGKNVTLKSYGIGGYNRQLAEVFAEGKNVNLEMVRSGMAEVYRGRIANGVDTELYRRAESFAKRKRKGIWRLGSKYKSPREWRKENPRK